MPTRTRIFEIGDKKYKQLPNRSWINIDNPSDKLSRRKFDSLYGKLKEQGFSSYEEKAKSRKALGIGKSVKQHKIKEGDFYYTARFNNIDTLYNLIDTLPENAIAFIKTRVILFDYEKSPKIWFSATPYARPSALSNMDIDERISNKFGGLEYDIDKYEIAFKFTNR